MWYYEKRLEMPVRISKPDLRFTKALLTQLGGPDGELSASLRYLSQRYTMPTGKTKGLLTDIGTEELAHYEMICTMLYQLTKGASIKELKAAGLDTNYSVHGKACYPADSNGVPWTATYIQATGDPIADLNEDLAAEAKARAAYDRLILQTDDPDVKDTLKFLREREIVHYQRFGEALVSIQDAILP